MKKNHGFTLIEMLAVLVIIILLTSVVVPSIINLITKNKNKLSKQTQDIIYSATDLYLSENNNYSKNIGNVYCITLSTLVNDGKLIAPINDFKTGKEIDLNRSVEARVNKYSEFEYSIKSLNDCSEKRGYEENILKGSDPDLLDNMVPVIYENGVWVKADTDKKWYSYENKMWANAVTVSDNKYFSLESGTEIQEQDITGYYVWIPRFEYKEITTKNEQEIQINFISKNKSNSSKGYIISDAFKFNSYDLNGIWVSKYEASSDDAKTLCSQTKTEGNCNVNTNNVLFKPTNSSWTNISLSVAYSVIDKMNISGNIYGFDDNSLLHLIKNSEWDVVSYLSMSKYGDLNQSSNTTGNEYGIYDMNGNSDEFVMANLDNQISLSGFKSMPDSNYYDLIESSNNTSFKTSGWFNDSEVLPTSDLPWIIRGGNSSDGDLAGIFAYKNSDGSPNPTTSFRAVIIKK